MIERDPRLAAAFPKPPQACYRRGPNLTSLLIKARLPQQHMVATRANTGTGEVGMRGCGRNGRRQMCRLCPHLGPAADQSVVISEAVISNNNEVIKIKDNINCTTSSVLYLITCKKRGCAMQYIGETGRMLYECYVEHEDSARDPDTNKTVGRHFQLHGHTTDQIEMIGIEHVRGGIAVRKARQKALIR